MSSAPGEGTLRTASRRRRVSHALCQSRSATSSVCAARSAATGRGVRQRRGDLDPVTPLWSREESDSPASWSRRGIGAANERGAAASSCSSAPRAFPNRLQADLDSWRAAVQGFADRRPRDTGVGRPVGLVTTCWPTGFELPSRRCSAGPSHDAFHRACVGRLGWIRGHPRLARTQYAMWRRLVWSLPTGRSSLS